MPAIADDRAVDPHAVIDPPLMPPIAHPRSLSEAAAAVTDYSLRTEMRRVGLAHASTVARADASVTLPRAAFDAMQRRLREFDALRRAFGDGTLRLLAFDTAPPHEVRELTLPSSDDAMTDAALRGRLLTQCFAATDVPRVQRALLALDSDVTTMVQWRDPGSPGQRRLVHLLPLDPQQPGMRWACLLSLSHEPHAAEYSARHPSTKPSPRPRVEARPLPSP